MGSTQRVHRSGQFLSTSQDDVESGVAVSNLLASLPQNGAQKSSIQVRNVSTKDLKELEVSPDMIHPFICSTRSVQRGSRTRHRMPSHPTCPTVFQLHVPVPGWYSEVRVLLSSRIGENLSVKRGITHPRPSTYCGGGSNICGDGRVVHHVEARRGPGATYPCH